MWYGEKSRFRSKRRRTRSDGVLWWAHQDSNLGPSDYESDALTN